MQYFAVLALVAAAAASPASYSGAPIPACGWTYTVISVSTGYASVPVPLASGACSSTMASAYSGSVVSSAVPVTQISDGQIQATTSTPVVTVTPAAPVTQISDGQVQAPTSTPVSPCTQIVDGQPQCPLSTGYYPTGGVPTGAMPTGTGALPTSSYAPVPAVGGAAAHGPVAGLIAAAGFAVALL